MEKKQISYELLHTRQKVFKKMKYLYILFMSLCLTLLIQTSSNALTPTSTPTPKKSATSTVEQNVSDLKDKIASRVAELKLVDRRGVIGTVTEITNTQIKIQDGVGNTKFIDVDELTKFASPSAKGAFGISDITKGSRIGVLGLYNKQSRRILARFVDVLELPLIVNGAVATIDNKNFSVTILTTEGKQYSVDIENSTKTSEYSKGGGLTRAGFSKIVEEERITVVGFIDKKNKTNIVATRVILFPDIPKNPKIANVNPALNPDANTPSTGSGKKLTPL